MLQWADTFNRYGTSAALMLNGLYANNSDIDIVTDPDPSAGGTRCARMLLTSGSYDFRFAWPSGAVATMGGALRLWMAALPLDDATFCGWGLSDISNTLQVSLRVRSTGQISIYRGDPRSGGVLLTTTAVPVISANSWNHIEWKIKVDSSTGTVEVRVNGVTQIALTGQNTQATGLATSSQISFVNFHANGTPANVSDMYLKDFIIWDTTGTFNNNFLGSVSVIDIDTNADTSLTWTPSTGTVGWSILDNNPPLDDAAYISAATALSNTFGLGNLPADTTSVRGLVLINRTKKIDGGDGNVQMGIISGASTGLGTDRPITTAYTYWRDIMEADPATGAQFTPSAFNAASFKLARTV